MNKAGRTRDELIKNFGERPAPSNTFAGAAQPDFSTFPVTEIGDTMQHPPFPDRRTEYRAPASNLPMSVSAAQVKRDNCDRGNMPWDVEPGEVGPALAGTQMTAANTPVAKDSPEGMGEAVAEGDPGKLVGETVGTFVEPVVNIAGAAAGAMMDRKRTGGQ